MLAAVGRGWDVLVGMFLLGCSSSLSGAVPAPFPPLSLCSSHVGMWEAELESLQLIETTLHRQNIDCGEFGVQCSRVEMLIWYHLLNCTHILPLSCYYCNFLMPINFPFPLTLLRRPQFPWLLPLWMTDHVSQNNMTKLNLSLLRNKYTKNKTNKKKKREGGREMG